MIAIPDPQSYESIADWMELNIATTGEALSKADLSSLLEQAIGEEPSESLLSNIWIELSHRHSRYQNPSYVVEDRRIRSSRDMREAYEYISCLVLSLFGVLPAMQGGPKLFERVSALAMREYMNGEVFLFGWPVIDGGDAAIAERVRQVSVSIGERLIESPAERYNDRGVDIIAWKPFAENRSSQNIVLAQCAAGKNWRGKTTELPLASWIQYFHWACNPIKAFFVPTIIPDYLWHDVSTEAGILFDRIRIINLLSEGVQDPQLCNDLRDWTVTVLEEISLN